MSNPISVIKSPLTKKMALSSLTDQRITNILARAEVCDDSVLTDYADIATAMRELQQRRATDSTLEKIYNKARAEGVEMFVEFNRQLASDYPMAMVAKALEVTELNGEQFAARLRKEHGDESLKNTVASLDAENNAEPVAFINGAWTLVYYRPPKELGLKVGDKLYAAPPVPGMLTDEQIDAVLDSQANIAYVIADKRERLRMFAREILRTATPAPDHDSQKNVLNGFLTHDEEV